MDWRRKMLILLFLKNYMMRDVFFFYMLLFVHENRNRVVRRRRILTHARTYSIIDRMPHQTTRLFRLFEENDTNCKDNLRMDRNCFLQLCDLLHVNAGLIDSQYLSVKEQVAIFLSVLAHHLKNRKVRFDFCRSGETVSKYFHIVLKAVLSLHRVLLIVPTTPNPNVDDQRWLPFSDSLGALDGTHIYVRVSKEDKHRYRNRKSDISVNVLAACDRNKNFIYILTGWEGSASDSRVLKDALRRPNGFKVPVGNYYLCENGYTNGLGFFTPYRGIRYHLKEWGAGMELPQNYKEYWNMKHCKARNVIECAFGILKERWAILRSKHYYPIRNQNQIILACGLLHNFIRLTMSRDPLEDWVNKDPNAGYGNDDQPVDYIDVVQQTEEWNFRRDQMAQNMFAEWLARHH